MELLIASVQLNSNNQFDVIIDNKGELDYAYIFRRTGPMYERYAD